MNLDFNDATIESGSVYLEPGIHDVRIKSITSGLSSQKQTPYIEVTVEDKAGKTCAQNYYTSTTIKPGSTKSAWDISKNNLLQITAAALNITDPEIAKSKMPSAADTASLSTSLNTLLVGKQFSIRINGEEIIPTDPAKQNWIKSIFGTGKFAVPTGLKNTLSFNETTHIKRKTALPGAGNNGVVKATTATQNWD